MEVELAALLAAATDVAVVAVVGDAVVALVAATGAAVAVVEG